MVILGSCFEVEDERRELVLRDLAAMSFRGHGGILAGSRQRIVMAISL